MPLRKISAEAFARRLKETTAEPDKRFALFLGAGCSVTSGIPSAGSLVRDDWLRRLHRYDAPEQEFDAWIAESFPDYDAASPASSYGQVMERLFLQSEERQREIERLCDGRFPGFGYAALASLIAMPGGAFNVVLTTNFDDLVADALYLFTRARPLVIHHESLAGFIRSTRTRPLVVKLHGDNRLAPRNTVEETSTLGEIQRQVTSLLHDRGLIFIGYSGNDHGIAKMLEGLNDAALPLGIYWVNAEEPRGVLAEWLGKRNAIWIEKADFDEFMLLVRDAFDLPHPEQRRFDEVFKKYKSTYTELSQRVLALGNTVPGATALKEAVKRTDASFPDWYAVELEASRHEDDPAEMDSIYRRGLEQFPDSAELGGNYALFLHERTEEYDRAEAFYRRVLEIEPSHAINLGNYALFLEQVRKRHREAEEYYRRALESDPEDANNTANYAEFLSRVRNDKDRADKLFRRALELEPENGIALLNYAIFMESVRKDADKAEELYLRAIYTDRDNATFMGNYADFLVNVRHDPDRAQMLFLQAIEADPTHAHNLANYASFLTSARKQHDRAEEFYERALEAQPANADTLGNYANFLMVVRKDHDRAEEMYRRAIDADATHANNLGNYATFVTDILREHDRADDLYRRAIEADPSQASTLGNYALFLNEIRSDKERAEEFFRRAIEADPTHAGNLSNFALFLLEVREEHDEAEKFFGRAVDADPTNANALGAYATFLKNVRKAYDRAEEFYRRAIAADPAHATNLCNFAGFLLGMSKDEEGLEFLTEAFAHSDSTTLPLVVELQFYRLVHAPDTTRIETLKALKAHLLNGARSPGWDFSLNLARAEETGDRDAGWYRALARVITEDADLSLLNGWPAWEAA